MKLCRAWRRCQAAILFLLAGCAAVTQEAPPGGASPIATPQTVEAVAPPASEDPQFGPAPLKRDTWPALEVTRRTLEFGDVDQGEKLSLSFAVKNCGSGTLRLWSVVCESPFYATRWDDPILPGESGAIELAGDTIQTAGPADLKVWVHSNDPNQPALELRLRGAVFPPLTTEPATISLSAPAGASASLQVIFRPTRGGKLDIERVQCRARDIVVGEIVPAPDRMSCAIPLRLVPDTRPHEKKTSLEVTARRDGGEARRIRIPVSIEHQDCLEILPAATLEFTRAEVTALKEGRERAIVKSVNFRARDGGTPNYSIEGIELAKRFRGLIETSIETVDAGREYRVVFTLAPTDGKLRPMTGKAIVSTNLVAYPQRTITVNIE